MSLIACSEHCRHQQEGYCSLNQVTLLSGLPSAKCGYFEQPEDSTIPALPQDSQRLTNTANRN